MPCEAFNVFKTCEGHQNELQRDELLHDGQEECHLHPHEDHVQRLHICSLCWNSFKIMLPHRAATCSLIRKKFWRKIGFENDLD
jgi:hypothetical protein